MYGVTQTLFGANHFSLVDTKILVTGHLQASKAAQPGAVSSDRLLFLGGVRVGSQIVDILHDFDVIARCYFNRTSSIRRIRHILGFGNIQTNRCGIKFQQVKGPCCLCHPHKPVFGSI